MRKLLMMLTAAVVFGATLTGFGETVTNVRGVQRPNSNLVDIYYDLNAVDGGTYKVDVSIEGRTSEVSATTFSGDVGEGIAPGKNRHIVWEAGIDWRGNKGDVKAVVMARLEARKEKPKKIQLLAGGPYWADRNIGADNPWDYGLYFWWGDTTGHRPSGKTFSVSFTKLNTPTMGKDIDTLQNEGWIVLKRGTYVLAPAHDAAHVQWGGAWRMPTYQELYDLCYNKCDWTWTTQNGVKGYVVHGRGVYASNSIFLPAAGSGEETTLYNPGSGGYFWSSSTGSDRYWLSYKLDFFGSTLIQAGSSYRSSGFSIRPVQGSIK